MDVFVDVFVAPERVDARGLLNDPTLLAALKRELHARGLPARSLTYCDTTSQEEHCIAFEAGADLAQAVLASIPEVSSAKAA